MACSIKKKVLKTLFLKRRLRILERNKSREITSFIAMNPSKAARMDEFNKNVSEPIRIVTFKIEAVNRLINRINNN